MTMPRVISIVDYGLGNLFSVSRAIHHMGVRFKLVKTPHEIDQSDFLLLPGVGSFQRGVSELKSRGLFEPIRRYVDSGKPILGICLGMQLFFEDSEESKGTSGFGFIKGSVVRIAPKNDSLKVPHIGWSRLQASDGCIDRATVDQRSFYFVHSFYPNVDPQYVLATTCYRDRKINALIKKDNIIGCQFHPEKSAEAGGQLLKALLIDGNSFCAEQKYFVQREVVNNEK